MNKLFALAIFGLALVVGAGTTIEVMTLFPDWLPRAPNRTVDEARDKALVSHTRVEAERASVAMRVDRMLRGAQPE